MLLRIEKVVLQRQLGHNTVPFQVVLGQLAQRHGILQFPLLFIEARLGIHIIITPRTAPVRIFLIHGHVRHLLVGYV